jgi:N-acyl-L-homoserine lactone synthetase
MTEAQYSMQKMATKLNWLLEEAGRQAKAGNADIAAHFEVVARESAFLLKDLEMYVTRNPSATKENILDVLKYVSGASN